ncbi:MAG: hypothetical protein KJ067_20820 [Vicinamibacteria bacterium]|nr:hypothetical protein [Vicinamibacteria bacterium]
MADDPWETLLRFHSELLEPRFQALEGAMTSTEAWQRRVDAHFAEIHRRFDRLEQIGRLHRQEPAGR